MCDSTRVVKILYPTRPILCVGLETAWNRQAQGLCVHCGDRLAVTDKEMDNWEVECDGVSCQECYDAVNRAIQEVCEAVSWTDHELMTDLREERYDGEIYDCWFHYGAMVEHRSNRPLCLGLLWDAGLCFGDLYQPRAEWVRKTTDQ